MTRIKYHVPHILQTRAHAHAHEPHAYAPSYRHLHTHTHTYMHTHHTLTRKHTRTHTTLTSCRIEATPYFKNTRPHTRTRTHAHTTSLSLTHMASSSYATADCRKDGKKILRLCRIFSSLVPGKLGLLWDL